MSEAQVTVLRDLAANNKEGFARLEAEFIKNGKLTAEQKDEFKSMRDSTREILARQPTLQDKSLNSVLQTSREDLLYVDQSISTQLKRLLNIAPTGAGVESDDADGMFDSVRLQIVLLTADLRDWLDSLTMVQVAVSAIGAVFDAIGKAVQFVKDAFNGMETHNRVLVAISVIAGAAVGALVAPVLAVSSAIGLLVGALTGLVGGGYLSQLADWVNGLIDKAKKRIKGEPTEEQKARALRYDASTEKLRKYGSELPKEVIDMLAKTNRDATGTSTWPPPGCSPGVTKPASSTCWAPRER